MIILSLELERLLYEEAERRYPYECCGILLGWRNADGARFVQEIYSVDNGLERQLQRAHFAISANAVLQAELSASEKNYEIVGFYHSHTDCEAVASREDSRFALPDMSYPILSVVKGRATALSSWEKPLSSHYEELTREEIYIRNR